MSTPHEPQNLGSTPNQNDPGGSMPAQPADSGSTSPSLDRSVDPAQQPPAGRPIQSGQPAQPGQYDPTAQAGLSGRQPPGQDDPTAQYGQQQYGQQPYGQSDPAGQPGTVGQPGMAQPGMVGQPGMAPVPPATNNKNRNIIYAVVAVVVIGVIAFFVIRSQKTDTVNANVGDCVQIVDANATPPKTNQLDCADPKATYVVTESGSNIDCDPKEAKYYETKGGDKVVCMRPNFKVGECAKVEGAANGDMEKIDCAAAADTDVKLASLDTTSADEGKCTEGQFAYVFAKRNMVYCFASAKP